MTMGPFRDGWTKADVEQVIAADDPADLAYAPVVVSMDPPDAAWAADVCRRLSDHPDEWVRGNAILGFGHLARTTGELDEAVVIPIVQAARTDPSPVVAGKADDAVSDLQHWLGWRFPAQP
jgi:hypothetical protein